MIADCTDERYMINGVRFVISAGNWGWMVGGVWGLEFGVASPELF